MMVSWPPCYGKREHSGVVFVLAKWAGSVCIVQVLKLELRSTELISPRCENRMRRHRHSRPKHRVVASCGAQIRLISLRSPLGLLMWAARSTKATRARPATQHCDPTRRLATHGILIWGQSPGCCARQ